MHAHSRIIAAALVTLSVVASIGAGGAAGATPDPKVPEVVLTAAEEQALQAQVDQHLGDYGGGEQIGINQIAYDNGQMILTIPLPGEKKARAVDEPVTAQGVADCRALFACIWEDTNFNGRRLDRTRCETLTLAAPFNSSLASIHNAQSSGTQTLIYNSARNILNANFPGSRINDTGVLNRSQARYWRVCP